MEQDLHYLQKFRLALDIYSEDVAPEIGVNNRRAANDLGNAEYLFRQAISSAGVSQLERMGIYVPIFLSRIHSLKKSLEVNDSKAIAQYKTFVDERIHLTYNTIDALMEKDGISPATPTAARNPQSEPQAKRFKYLPILSFLASRKS